MTALESRKQLLIAESELNRAQLVMEWQSVAGEVHSLSQQAKTISSMVSAIATLVGGIVLWRRTKQAARDNEKVSWWQNLVRGASVIGSFWSEIRPADQKRNED